MESLNENDRVLLTFHNSTFQTCLILDLIIWNILVFDMEASELKLFDVWMFKCSSLKTNLLDASRDYWNLIGLLAAITENLLDASRDYWKLVGC